MSELSVGQAAFLTSVRSLRERACARLLIDSIRSFGGALSDSPIWLFEAEGLWTARDDPVDLNIHVFSMNVPETVKGYTFADKVCACAQAEEMASSAVQSLIWIDPVVLMVAPPLSFNLGKSFDAAVRPVHIKNVGLPVGVPIDGFWKKIAMNAGVNDIEATVETFIEGQCIRSYFNSHAFAINPSKGLLRKWYERFESLVCDEEFQGGLDQVHQIFLHQAIWSVLLVTSLDPNRIRLLSPDYNYPYNLHESVPEDRKAGSLNELVCIAYENRSLDPNQVDDIDIHEPLRSWLLERATMSDSLHLE